MQSYWHLQRTSSSSAFASGHGHGRAELLSAAAEDVLIFKYSQAAGSGVAAQSSWHLQRTSSSSAVACGPGHGCVVLLAAAADDVLIFKYSQAAGSGVAAQSFWWQQQSFWHLHRTSSSSAVASGLGHGRTVLLAAVAEDVIPFKVLQAAGSGVAAESFFIAAAAEVSVVISYWQQAQALQHCLLRHLQRATVLYPLQLFASSGLGQLGTSKSCRPCWKLM